MTKFPKPPALVFTLSLLFVHELDTTLHYTTQKTIEEKKYNKHLVSQQCLSISPKLVNICLIVVVMLVVDFSELEIRSDEF